MVNFLSSPIFTEPRFRGKVLQSNLIEFAIFRSRLIVSEKQNSSPWFNNSYLPKVRDVAFFSVTYSNFDKQALPLGGI